MPRKSGITVENNFKSGLITEVTGVNSPETSVVQSDNVIYDRRGRATRRLGMDFEDGYFTTYLQPFTPYGGVVAEFIWETVSDVSNISFVVQQYSNQIFFFASNVGVLSQNRKPFTVNLFNHRVAGWSDEYIYNNTASFSAGDGTLFVAHPYCQPFYIRYNAATDSITVTEIDIQIRDFEGVNDGLAVDERPLTLSNAHHYNLFNQGWWQFIKNQGAAGTITNAIDSWRNDGIDTRTDYPSNVDVWWYYKGVGVRDNPDNPIPDVFLIEYISKIAVGNTPAPKGHYIFNAFQTARNGVMGFPFGTVPETHSSGNRPSAIAFWFGRVFYAGVRKDKFSSNIYFSQIVERDEQYGACYQQQDPTAEELHDLLPTDGGVIRIQDIVNVVDMRVIGSSLYIFATNGVWAITGSNEGGFRANDYQVTKVSSFGVLNRESIVVIGDLPVWWNHDGIYALQQDPTASTSVTNLTESTIQAFFDGIPSYGKQYCKGAYNELEGLVYWLWRSAPPNVFAERYHYDRILVLDTVTKAFYPYSIGYSVPRISGVLAVRDANGKRSFKFPTTGLMTPVTGLHALTYSDMTDLNFCDWRTVPAWTKEYTSEFITGYKVRGELMNKFQTNYVTVITEAEATSSVWFQGVWDYSNSNLSGRWTNPQQAYKTKLYYADYQRSKLKIRGQGASLQYRFFSDGRAPFTIIGWAGLDTSNTVP